MSERLDSIKERMIEADCAGNIVAYCELLEKKKDDFFFELAMAKNELVEINRARMNIAKQNKELVEAMKFYANTESWCDPHEPYDSSSIGSNDCEEWDMGNMKPDNVGGKLARETLKKLGIE